jgi:hypothetical protein
MRACVGVAQESSSSSYPVFGCHGMLISLHFEGGRRDTALSWINNYGTLPTQLKISPAQAPIANCFAQICQTRMCPWGCMHGLHRLSSLDASFNLGMARLLLVNRLHESKHLSGL